MKNVIYFIIACLISPPLLASDVYGRFALTEPGIHKFYVEFGGDRAEEIYNKLSATEIVRDGATLKFGSGILCIHYLPNSGYLPDSYRCELAITVNKDGASLNK